MRQESGLRRRTGHHSSGCRQVAVVRRFDHIGRNFAGHTADSQCCSLAVVRTHIAAADIPLVADTVDRAETGQHLVEKNLLLAGKSSHRV